MCADPTRATIRCQPLRIAVISSPASGRYAGQPSQWVKGGRDDQLPLVAAHNGAIERVSRAEPRDGTIEIGYSRGSQKLFRQFATPTAGSRLVVKAVDVEESADPVVVQRWVPVSTLRPVRADPNGI